MQVSGKTKEQWLEQMKAYPCFKPAVPFYDFCLNMDTPVKRYDCDKCVEVNKLCDCIE